MPYTTKAAVEAWMGTTLGGDEDAIDNLIRNAERDIDEYVGPRPVQEDGRKFGDPQGTNVLRLSDGQKQVLSDATAAQVEYRITMTDDFFVEDQRESVTGPDHTESGKVGRCGPRARSALNGSGLLNLSGRLV